MNITTLLSYIIMLSIWIIPENIETNKDPDVVYNNEPVSEECSNVVLGGVYKISLSENPFDTKALYIKVLEIREEYYRSIYVSEDGKRKYEGKGKGRSDRCRNLEAFELVKGETL